MDQLELMRVMDVTRSQASIASAAIDFDRNYVLHKIPAMF